MITNKERQPTKLALEVAARIWCMPKTEKLVMIPELTEEFARKIDKYLDALIWCSGSADFGRGGKAELGWKKLCEPLLNT